MQLYKMHHQFLFQRRYAERWQRKGTWAIEWGLLTKFRLLACLLLVTTSRVTADAQSGAAELVPLFMWGRVASAGITLIFHLPTIYTLLSCWCKALSATKSFTCDICFSIFLRENRPVKGCPYQRKKNTCGNPRIAIQEAGGGIVYDNWQKRAESSWTGWQRAISCGSSKRNTLQTRVT